MRLIGDLQKTDAGDGPESPNGGPPSSANVAVSFEFFPPTDPAMETTLRLSIRRLEPLSPQFVSVTCGADGSTRDRTVQLVNQLKLSTNLPIAPHVTGIGATREQLKDLARTYLKSGIRHLVALRGDLPASAEETRPLSGIEVVQALRSAGEFHISVAAYPEVHPRARSARDDLDELKRKIDAGATQAITQFFYDNDTYLRFRDSCLRAGITAPIVPGILPICRFQQVRRFARRCGTNIPRWLDELFTGLDDDADSSRLLGAVVLLEQLERLRRHGVGAFHFYTLNRCELTYAACHALGVRPNRQADRP